MASLLKKSSLQQQSINLENPTNDNSPIRIALLGGPRSGKTSIISKLSLGSFRDTYYPTHQTQPILFTFSPVSILSRCILDEFDMSSTLQLIGQNNHLVLSPVIYQAYSKLAPSNNSSITNQNRPSTIISNHEDKIITSTNQFYTSYNHKNELDAHAYIPPQITPILVELIDTAAFNPDQVVPFLEASLYIKLDREILKNLANEPRRPVSTNPLLVASGASELNGSVDGYFFVYSAVPSYNPPSYNEVLESTGKNYDMTPESSLNDDDGDLQPVTSTTSYQSLDGSNKTLTITNTAGDTTFNLLSIMKIALSEAWKEYYTYKTRWEEGKESDVFSFKSALKNLWRENNLIETSKNEMKADLTKLKLLDNSMDPADPSCPPPIWVICTHKNNKLASPKLINDGIKLSKFWKCGFIAIDVTDENIDESLALIIREILERKKLQAQFKKKKKT